MQGQPNPRFLQNLCLAAKIFKDLAKTEFAARPADALATLLKSVELIQKAMRLSAAQPGAEDHLKRMLHSHLQVAKEFQAKIIAMHQQYHSHQEESRRSASPSPPSPGMWAEGSSSCSDSPRRDSKSNSDVCEHK